MVRDVSTVPTQAITRNAKPSQSRPFLSHLQRVLDHDGERLFLGGGDTGREPGTFLSVACAQDLIAARKYNVLSNMKSPIWATLEEAQNATYVTSGLGGGRSDRLGT